MTEIYLYGLHAVSASLNQSRRDIKRVYVSQDRADQRVQEILDAAFQKNIPIERLDPRKMQQRFGEINHQGIVASAAPLPQYGERHLPELIDSAKEPLLVLILDSITDPHNLGACLRTADATGVDFVIIPKDKSVGLTAVVSKVACGAAETVPLVQVTNLVRAMEALKERGIWIYGAAGEASQSLYQQSCRGSMAIAMGAEGKGLRRLTREHCDGLFSLPMLGSVESLNVSVATGVSLYEVLRQRQRDDR